MARKSVKIKKKLNIAIYGILCILVILFIFCAARTEDSSFGKWESQSDLDFGKGWTHISDEENTEIDLPVSLGKKSGSETVVSKLLPDEIQKGDYLFMATCHSSLQVYVGGEPIYQYGLEAKSESFFRAPPNVLHEIELNPQYAGKEIKLIIASEVSSYKGKINGIQYGDKTSFLMAYISDHLFSLVVCILILGMALFLFAVWIAVRKIVKQDEFLYLAILSLTMFLWQINETYLPQIFIGHPALLTVLSFEALALLPIPLLFLLQENAGNIIRSVTGIFLGTSIMAFLVCNGLFFARAMDFAESVWIVHLNLIAGIAVIFYNTLMDSQKLVNLENGESEEKDDTEKKKMVVKVSTWGFLFMACTAVIDIIRFHVAAVENYNMIKIGFIVYILTFSIDSVRNGFKLVSLGEKAAKYESLAYRDMLTGVLNRTAYKEAMQHLDDNPQERANTAVIVIDINNLKMVNDAMGHAVGDRYILSNLELIRKHFGNIGKIYRVGGDEFVILVSGSNDDRFRWALHRMEQDVDSEGASNFAFGYAYFETEDGAIQNTAKRADTLMYQKKQKQKRKQ